MQVTISSVRELGEVIRSVRKTSHVRIDDAASMTGVSKQFASDVEHGKPTVEMGRVLLLLQALGIELRADIPAEAMKALLDLRKAGGIPTGKDRWPMSHSATPSIGIGKTRKASPKSATKPSKGKPDPSDGKA